MEKTKFVPDGNSWELPKLRSVSVIKHVTVLLNRCMENVLFTEFLKVAIQIRIIISSEREQAKDQYRFFKFQANYSNEF